jgi:hypothetical protein
VRIETAVVVSVIFVGVIVVVISVIVVVISVIVVVIGVIVVVIGVIVINAAFPKGDRVDQGREFEDPHSVLHGTLHDRLESFFQSQPPCNHQVSRTQGRYLPRGGLKVVRVGADGHQDLDTRPIPNYLAHQIAGDGRRRHNRQIR